MNVLDRRFSEANGRYVLLTFLAFLAVVAAVTVYLHTRFYTAPGTTVYDIHFGTGNIVRNLAEGNGFVTTKWMMGQALYTSRMPVSPLALFAISQVSTDILFVWIVKNLVFLSFSFFFVYAVLRHADASLRTSLAAVALICAVCFAVRSILFGIAYEEGYAIHFMFGLFAGLYTVNPVLFGISAAALYMTKSTYAVFVLAVTAYFAVYAWRPLAYRALIPAAMVLAVYGGWVGYAKTHTDFTPTPLMLSSLNASNLYLGTHPKLFEIYPEIDNDFLIDYYPYGPDEPITSEAAYVDYFQSRAIDNIMNNKLGFIVGAFRNLIAFQFDPRALGIHPPQITDPETDLARYSNPFDPFRFIQLVVLNAAIGLALWQFWRHRRWLSMEVFFLLLYATVAAPHIIGGNEQRHTQPLIIFATMFLSAQLLARRPVPREATA